MFWKSKQTSPEMFSIETRDRRKHFRVYPAKNAPIFFTLDGRRVQVINISAGGLSFKNTSLRKGDSLTIEFKLPPKNVSISTQLVIKCVDDRNNCHCAFSNLGDNESEAIHQYVLTRQKEMIRERKKS